MKLQPESNNLSDFLQELHEVNFSNPAIRQLATNLFNEAQKEIEKIEAAFHFVRDEISHSWDIRQEKVTCISSDVLEQKHGICYAKSNLLAALLRSQGIPTGFCYQRLMLFDTPEQGYCIHALNAVYMSTLHKWIRLDARGNKPGVDAQFSINEEKLAFSVNEQLGEFDYKTIYTIPNTQTIETLRNATNALHMYLHDLPVSI